MILNATNGWIYFSTGWHRVARTNAVLWFLFESVRQGPDGPGATENGGIMGIIWESWESGRTENPRKSWLWQKLQANHSRISRMHPGWDGILDDFWTDCNVAVCRGKEEKKYAPTRTEAVLRRGSCGIFRDFIDSTRCPSCMPSRSRAGRRQWLLRYLRKRGAQARAKVTSFLKENGFEHNVNSKKKKGWFGWDLSGSWPCQNHREPGVYLDKLWFSVIFVQALDTHILSTWRSYRRMWTSPTFFWKLGERWWEMVRDGERWWEMVRDGERWWEMVRDGERWWEMVRDGERHRETASEFCKILKVERLGEIIPCPGHRIVEQIRLCKIRVATQPSSWLSWKIPIQRWGNGVPRRNWAVFLCGKTHRIP